jgi:hypothetical protein
MIYPTNRKTCSFEKRKLTKKDIRMLTECGIELYKENGMYTTVGIRPIDSTSSEWRGFMNVMRESHLGKSPVRLSMLTSPTTHCNRALVNELVRGVVASNFAPCIDTLLCQRVMGCFQGAREVLPLIVKFLERPPIDMCPLAVCLKPGDISATVNISFNRFFFDLNVIVP